MVGDSTQIDLRTGVLLNVSQWNFLGVSCHVISSVQNCSVYLNDQLVGTETDTTELTLHSEGLMIGTRFLNSTSLSYIGGIDQVHAYNRSLNSSEMNELYNSGLGYLCSQNYVNTSWSDYYNITACNISDEQTQERNRTEYDANECGLLINTTYYENQTVSCDYCSPSINYTSDYGDWSDTELDCGVRYRSYNDGNYYTCCNVTLLESDCFEDDNSTTQSTYNEEDAKDCKGLQTGFVRIELFVLLFAISLFFILFGFATDKPYLAMVGFFFIFMMGFIVQEGHLGVRTGFIENVTGNVTTTTYTYDGWDGANHHLIGWIIMIVGGLLFALSMFYLGGDENEF